jgi:tetratricopeptide (TPR) repeat protein
MPEKKNHIIIKPEFNEFVQAVDEYTAQLPLVIRESIRQVLYCEYEEKYEEMEKLCNDILEKNPGNTEALSLLGRAQLSQRKYQEAEQVFREILDKSRREIMSVSSTA